MFDRKSSLVPAAAALFVLTALPASAQFSGAPGSTGIFDVSSVHWETYGYSWYLEVTLTRTSTSANPQFHQAQLIP